MELEVHPLPYLFEGAFRTEAQLFPNHREIVVGRSFLFELT
jgi:hypothetical protein